MNTNTAPASSWVRLGYLQSCVIRRARLSPNPVGPHGSFTVTAPACGDRHLWGIEVVLDDPNAPTVQTWTGPTLDAVVDAAEAALDSYCFNDDLPEYEDEEMDDEEARERAIESLFPQPLPGYDAGRSL